MKTMKQLFLAGLAAASCTLALAQSGYPSKPIRLIVPFPAGGGTDLIARLVADKLSQRLRQPIVVDNRVGAGGIVGTEAAARSAPDGYTLVMGTSGTMLMLPHLQKVPFNVLTDFAPVGQITQGGLVIVANAQSGIRTVADMDRIARADPNGLSYASGGIGTGGHIIGESLKFITKMPLVHIAYKGTGGATNDLLGGQVPVMIGDTQVTIQHVRSGRLNAVAVVGTERNACLPEVRTLKEQGVDFDLTYWWGLFAPAKTPVAIVDRINRELNAALKAPDTRDELAKMCQGPAEGSPQQYGKLVAKENAAWGKLIQGAQIRAE
ncbi:MAG: tripartite tricarboxylate transporter substrate binding protein [Pseudomonadota bacterium]